MRLIEYLEMLSNNKNPFIVEVPEEVVVDPSGKLIATKELLEKVSFPFFRGKKNESTLYILGTSHVLPFSSLQKSALPYINEAKFAFFEITKYAPISPAKIYEKLCEMGVLFEHEENNDWYKQLSPTVLDLLKQSMKCFFVGLNIALPSLKKINPEFATMIYMLGCRPATGMDDELEEIFGENVGALEGIERMDQLKNLKMPLSELEFFTLKNTSVLRDYAYEFNLAAAKRNFQWMHKIIQVGAHSKEPVLVCVGALHLEGATGIISLLHHFGYEMSIMQDGYFQRFTISNNSMDDVEGNELLENINIVISNQIEEMLTPVLPDTKPRNIISSYLSFSIFPEYSRTLSEQVHIQSESEGGKYRIDVAHLS